MLKIFHLLRSKGMNGINYLFCTFLWILACSRFLREFLLAFYGRQQVLIKIPYSQNICLFDVWKQIFLFMPIIFRLSKWTPIQFTNWKCGKESKKCWVFRKVSLFLSKSLSWLWLYTVLSIMSYLPKLNNPVSFMFSFHFLSHNFINLWCILIKIMSSFSTLILCYHQWQH